MHQQGVTRTKGAPISGHSAIQPKPRADATLRPILKLQRVFGNRAVQRMLSTEYGPSQAETDGRLESAVGEGVTSPGTSLDSETRDFMEARFGRDFSAVRIHSDSAAAKSSRAIDANAYTVGQDIVFAEGKYSPGSVEGQRLLAHELTHVVQQGSGPVAGALTAGSSMSISDPGDSFEQAAESQAEQVISGAAGERKQSAADATAGVSVQRDDDSQDDTVSKVAGVPHAGVEFAEGAEATTNTVETAEGIAKGWAGYEPALGPLPASVAAAAEGSPGFMDTVGAAQVAQVERGFGGLTPPGITLGNALAPAALYGGIKEGSEAIESMNKQGANLENTPNLVQAGLETTSGGIGSLGLAGGVLSALGATEAGGALAGTAAAAAPVGMVAGAGALGMLAGKGMAEVADSSYTKTGAFGVDPDTGKNQSAMDWGANWGTDWDKAHNQGEASITGGILAGAGGIVGGLSGAAYGAGNWLADKI
jgi:hypothetical protein